MSNIAKLSAQKEALLDELQAMAGASNFSMTKFSKLENAITEIDEQLKASERAQALSASRAQPVSHIADMGFKTLGEQLIAIKSAALGNRVDNRLVKAASETDPSGGGFLVQTDFVNDVWTRVYDNSELLKRVRRLTLTSGAGNLKYPAVDETSRANGSRYGGVTSYWQPENQTITPSQPKFRMVNFDLKRVSCLLQASDEIMQDTALFTNIATRAFADELQFRVEDAIFEGTGTDMPAGFTKSNSLVVVAKDNLQVAATVTMSNLTNMMARTFPNAKNYVWICNQDVLPQIYQLSLTQGGAFPMFYPMGGATESPSAQLFGLPLLPVEYCSTLGTQNDIMLVNLDEYVLVDKGGPDSSWNPYIYWDHNQQGFKMTWRVDGNPLWNAPLTPFKGANSKSAFITLATRS